MRRTEAVDSGEAANKEENREDEEDVGEAIFELASACTKRIACMDVHGVYSQKCYN